MSECNLPSEPNEEEEADRVSKNRALKDIILSKFSTEVKDIANQIFDELVCEVLFDVHRDLKLGIYVPGSKKNIPPMSDDRLVTVVSELNIRSKTNMVYCELCKSSVKIAMFSRHLFKCWNVNNEKTSFSVRTSSRVARQRIQENLKVEKRRSNSVKSSEDKVVQPKPETKRKNKRKKA